MTRLDWWTGIILVLVGSFIGNAVLSGMWMHWSREWWHYLLPFWLGGAVGFVAAGLMAAAKRADAQGRWKEMAWRQKQIPTPEDCPRYSLAEIARLQARSRGIGGERN